MDKGKQLQAATDEDDAIFLEEGNQVKDPAAAATSSLYSRGLSTKLSRTRKGKSSAEEDNSDSDDTKPLCLRHTVIVHPLLVLVQLIFSGYHILGFKAVNIDPEHAEQVALVFALYRELSASLLMGLLALQAAHLGGYSIAINKKDLVRFVVLGVFSFGNVVGVVEALTKVSATNLAVMQPAIPVFTMMLSVIFRMETLTPFKALGLAMAVAGAVTIEVVKPGGHMGDRNPNDLVLGNVIIVLQCLSMASLLVLQKSVLSLYHPTVVTVWYYTIGSVLTILVCVGKNIPTRLYSFGGTSDPSPWIALVYAAVFGTFFNYNAYAWAGTVISPATISIYSTLQPIGTAILSVIFLHNYPTLPEILCGILVVAGLLLTMWAKDRESRLEREARHRASSVERRVPLVMAAEEGETTIEVDN